MQAKIQPGRALVIAGPQGSGKNLMARSVARKAGHYVEVDAAELRGAGRLDAVLAGEPDACIVHDIPKQPELLARLKECISQPTVHLAQPGGTVRTVRSPSFIFVTCDPDPFKGLDNRRFALVQVGGA